MHGTYHPAATRISNACDALSNHAIIPSRRLRILELQKRIDLFEISVLNNIRTLISAKSRDKNIILNNKCVEFSQHFLLKCIFDII